MKNDFIKYFQVIHSDCEYIQWFRLSKSVFNTNDDVVFRSIYIPPENTKFFKQNLLVLFVSEVQNINNNHDYVVLLGDFHARTANIPDINEIDEALFDFIYTDTDSVFDSDLNHILNVKGMSYDRYSQDKQTNRTGRLLVEFCHNNEILFV